jgi:hypothetical protein
MISIGEDPEATSEFAERGHFACRMSAVGRMLPRLPDCLLARLGILTSQDQKRDLVK